ncbi:histidine phosphatase family protein [Siculibacillus lacustris]|nr:histidine phosphatase family protein [Siculibacillus lacustris]
MSRSVLLIRHGLIVEDGAPQFLGRTDLPMTEEGEAQVREIATVLADYPPLDAIFCSDLRRSKRTAELLTTGRRTPIFVSQRLREIDMGEWEGLPRRDVEVFRPDEYAARGRDLAHYRVPGGESFSDLAARVLPLWQTIVSGADTRVAIAGHAGVNRVILAHVLGMPLENIFRIAQRPGCVSLVEWTRDGPSVRFLDLPPGSRGF